MRFVDEATITVRSGKGGGGSVSFRREKYIPKGGPDGGNGGKGGNLIFKADRQLLSLYDFRLKRVYEAENGQPGQGRQKFGRKGEDLVIALPPGTLVFELDEEDNETLIADITDLDEEVIICKGGRGGKGNMHFKSATMRAPRFAQPGEPGEERRIRLQLKILADIGLVGLPNAGKSTLISNVSAARPKIAAYPFTTLTPNLGVIQDDFGRQLVIADIPGLIEGAHEGQGLGHTFLKHVERTRFLVHLLAADDITDDEPFAGFDLINDELAKFNEELAHKKQLQIINKIDTISPERLEELKAMAKAEGRDLHFISALRGDGVEELVEEFWNLIPEETDEPETDPLDDLPAEPSED